jgi:hypothetical protein
VNPLQDYQLRRRGATNFQTFFFRGRPAENPNRRKVLPLGAYLNTTEKGEKPE